uniref:Uncharacterized protein n=1 Tax=Glossina austeni TaxID=7395 RepID=A0A1A9V7M3_GLOAU
MCEIKKNLHKNYKWNDFCVECKMELSRNSAYRWKYIEFSNSRKGSPAKNALTALTQGSKSSLLPLLILSRTRAMRSSFSTSKTSSSLGMFLELPFNFVNEGLSRPLLPAASPPPPHSPPPPSL